MDKQQEKVDIALLWVDGSDPKWIEEKNKYILPKNEKDKASVSDARFRDWDNLKYIFRGIEKFMPWVNKIHFITFGHLPKWLNIKHPKINVVNHKDFIPKEYLPTFNSHTIELNLHRIPGISDKFIEFNDDTFIVSHVMETDFFENGLPKDIAVLSPFNVKPNGIASIVMNNLEVINKYFSIDDIKKNKNKWFSLKYGKLLMRNFLFSNWSSINGIYETHSPSPFLKSTFEKVWNLETDLLDKTCQSKFREKHNVNQWLMRDWQLLEGNFYPRKPTFSKYTTLPDNLELILNILNNPKGCKLLCINDSLEVENFEETKEAINVGLSSIFPEESSFETSEG